MGLELGLVRVGRRGGPEDVRSCSVAGRVGSRRRLPGGLMGGDGCARFSSRNTQEYTRIYFWASKKCEYAYLRGFPSVFCM